MVVLVEVGEIGLKRPSLAILDVIDCWYQFWVQSRRLISELDCVYSILLFGLGVADLIRLMVPSAGFPFLRVVRLGHRFLSPVKSFLKENSCNVT